MNRSLADKEDTNVKANTHSAARPPTQWPPRPSQHPETDRESDEARPPEVTLPNQENIVALTYSQWIWGFQVLDSGSGSAQNNLIDFSINGTTFENTGGTYPAAAVAAGVYTADEFAAAVQTAMQAAVAAAGSPLCQRE
jgi:hypothetical protein